MKATLVGDLHGVIDKLNLNSHKPIIQIGDFGFRKSYEPFLQTPREELMIVGGNHDDYDKIHELPAYLGDFGIIPGTQKTFFCRGAWSIDRAYRIEGLSWWKAEELTLERGQEMLEAYLALKPEVMITHDCPDMLKGPMFGKAVYPNRTGAMLDMCLSLHLPKVWIFGHWHTSKEYRWGDTCTFHCLDICEHKEFELP